MTPVHPHIKNRVYPVGVQRFLQAVMTLAVAAYCLELALIWTTPEFGLRLLWFATIPLAPMVLLIAPNAWVSVCPISTVQTFSHRFGLNPRRRLSAKTTLRLQIAGWALMLLGIPSRHLLFNTVGRATFWTALGITAIVLIIGFLFRSMSGWCVGACPIRPVEVLYGQFALDRNRPEKCTVCTACIANCQRLVPEKSHGELLRNRLIAHMAKGFPGFVACYFLLDLLGLCQTEHRFFSGNVTELTIRLPQVGTVYGVMFAGFGLSWLTFQALERLGINERSIYRLVALSAFSAYYLGVAPEIREAWNWPLWSVPFLLAPPAAAMACVLLAPPTQTPSSKNVPISDPTP